VVAWQDGEHRVLRDGVVVVDDGEVTAVAATYEGRADRVIDARENVIAPGFVTAHAHVTDSPLTKSFIEDRGNKNFHMSGLYEFLAPLWSAMTPDMVRASARFSLLEMLQTGTTTVVDVGSVQADELVDLVGAVGIRAYVAPFYRSATWRVADSSRIEYDWLAPSEEEELFQAALDFAARHDGAYGGRVRTYLAPAQLDTCRPELLRRTLEVARERGLGVQIHAGQSVGEFQELVRRHGMTPVQLLAELGLLGEHLIVGHCIFVGGHSWLAYPDPVDLRLLAESGTAVAHCPWVFARRGIAMESVARYIDAGVRVCLGTDTFPQNMLSEMRVGATVAKIVEGNTEVATAADLFRAATVGGADALGRPDLGRIAPGSRADLVVFRTDTLSMTPLRDPIRNIVYNAERGDVDRVLVDGREILVDGRVPGLDEAELARAAQAQAEELWRAVRSSDGRPADAISPQSLPPYVHACTADHGRAHRTPSPN
jgi:cytosine/adenosine deaminase-related metal-dependent hydrolase